MLPSNLDKGSCTHTNPGYAQYCEWCGSETYFYSIELLKPWQEARKTVLAEMIAEDEVEFSSFV